MGVYVGEIGQGKFQDVEAIAGGRGKGAKSEGQKKHEEGKKTEEKKEMLAFKAQHMNQGCLTGNWILK